MTKCKCKKQFDIISSEGNFTVEVGDEVTTIGEYGGGLNVFIKCVWQKIRFDLESTDFHTKMKENK